MVKRVLGVVVIITALLAVIVYSQVRKTPLKVSGFIEAYEIRIGSRVGGRVAKVIATEGQSVHNGDVLVELEPFDLRERRSEAEKLLAGKRADVARMTAGFRSEEVDQAKARRD